MAEPSGQSDVSVWKEKEDQEVSWVTLEELGRQWGKGGVIC